METDRLLGLGQTKSKSTPIRSSAENGGAAAESGDGAGEDVEPAQHAVDPIGQRQQQMR